MRNLKEINFKMAIQQRMHDLDKQYQGYCHIVWEDFVPKSAGFIKVGRPMAFWKSLLMWPAPQQSGQTVTYEIVK